MAALAVSKPDSERERGYVAPSCEATGEVRSSLFHPDGYSLWQVEAELSAGADLHWGAARHGDEAVFVVEGDLVVDGVRCGPETAVIIEADVNASVHAATDVKLLHFGPSSIDAPSGGAMGPPLGDGHSVHVIPIEDARPLDSEVPDLARYYADSTCKTCRIAFFKVFSPQARVEGSHVHSEDEIIHVLTGEFHVGPTVLTAGMAVAIPGSYRYAYRTPGPFSFLNFRRDASTYVAKPGSTPILETVDAWRTSRDADAADG
jgi:hypothetical protein